MKVEVIALKGFGSTAKGGRVRLPRDQAKQLERMGIVQIAPVEVVPAAPVPKRTYLRRDMTAESRAAAKPAAAYPSYRPPVATPTKPDDDGKAQ